MLKAGAMTYAIVLSIIVGAFCLSLVWISTAHRNTRSIFRNKERLLVNSLTATDFVLNSENHSDEKLLLLNNDTVYTTKSTWGVFNYATIKAFKRKDTLNRALFTGVKVIDETFPALYIINNDKSLKLSGNTILKGTIYVPKKGVERAFIQGKSFSNRDLYQGTEKKSEKQLPSLNYYISNLDFERIISEKEVVHLDVLPQDSVFSFQKATNLYEKSIPISIRERLMGNLIIASKDSIIVSNSASLDNVILVAPKVRFEAGFEGSVQVFAEKGVVLEENVILNYPSSIYLKDEDSDFRRNDTVKVEIKKDAHLLGGILMTSTSPDFRNLIKLDIEDDASVVGLIYNQGETQLRGKIIGSIYTTRFYLNTKSSSYTNHLLDAEINSRKLPDYFIYPNWLEGNELKEEIIQWL